MSHTKTTKAGNTDIDQAERSVFVDLAISG
jgi:hypothetical protein